MDQTRRNTILARFFVAAAVALLVYAALGFLLAPHLLQRQLVALADQRLGQTLSIGKLKVNPFALSVELRELRLGQGSGAPLLAVRRVYVNLSLLSSGFGRGWVLSEAQTDGLQIQLEQQRDGNLNIAELAQHWVKTSPPEKSKDKVRFTVKHLLSSDGALTYRKVAVSGAPLETQVLPIRLELQNLSTLPDREGHYTVSARLADGAALTWRGDITLMPLQSEGDLSLEGLKLATVWRFIREDVRLAEPQGTLSLATHYIFGAASGQPDLGLSGLRVNAAGLRVVREGFAEPIVSLKTLEARDGSLQLARRTLVLPVVALGSGSVDVVRNADGIWNWAGFVRDQPSPVKAAKPRAVEPAQTWHVDLKAVSVDDVALRYEDRQRPATLTVQSAALFGKAAITADTGGDTLGLNVRDIDLRLKNLRLPATSAVRLTELHIEKGHLDLAKQSLGAARLSVHGGTLLIERGADGAFPLATSFAGSNATPSPQSPMHPPMHPWRYAIDSVSVQGLDVALSDRSFGKQAVEYRFGSVAVAANGIANTGAKAMAFNASARIASGGALSASGSASADLAKIDAKVKVSALALVPLQPFIARHVAVDLKSGSASATATIAYRVAAKKMSLTASGPVELANVRLNEAGSDETVIAWEKLSAADARLSLGPDRVLIKEIIVHSPEAKIDISEQRGLNLLQLFKHGSVPDKNPSPSRDDAKPSGFTVQIGEIKLRDGTVNFSDRSLALPFATQVMNFTGTATDLGTNRERRAKLKFEGDIGEFGSVQVDGQIESFAPKTFTQVHVSFENVDLPDLTPYSVTFLGRRIASGKLWLNLKYGIANGQLIGDNEVTIRDLRLGKPVDSPTALKLPLDLAVALLTDSEGKIRTAVPVTGDLNNPKFAIGTVIREAIGNLIKKIVTAPFRALASLFGNKHGKDDAGNVAFEPGSAKLRASENEKLQEVAKVLNERPQLKLVVQAPYAPGTDRAAMKEELARREVALAQGRSLESGERPAPMMFDDLVTQRALERLVNKKAADPAVVRNLVAQYAKKTGTQPRRAGMLTRETGDTEFYKAMYAWLVEAQQVGDDAMQKLAASRASAVLDKLRTAGTDAKRLQSGPVAPGKQKNDKVVTAELMLELDGAKPFTDAVDDSAVAQGQRKAGEL